MIPNAKNAGMMPQPYLKHLVVSFNSGITSAEVGIYVRCLSAETPDADVARVDKRIHKHCLLTFCKLCMVLRCHVEPSLGIQLLKWEWSRIIATRETCFKVTK